MGRYTITAGQNIYDVALHLYGSIEGIVDLMMCNPTLSLAQRLQAGQTLEFSDDFLLDEDVAAYFRTSGLTPAGGERQVYAKDFTRPLLAELLTDKGKTSASFSASGCGILEVDWGDNAPPHILALQETPRRYAHTFDSAVAGSRRIRLYGDAELRTLDLSAAAPSELYLLMPLRVEQFNLRDATLGIGALSLLRGTYRLDLRGLQCPDLRPLVACGELMTLDLRDSPLKPSVLDGYLFELVRRYGARRSGSVYLPCAPTGHYREPARDAAGSYAPVGGMEALWIITHEESWNEAASWKFIIDEKTYTYEPDDQRNI